MKKIFLTLINTLLCVIILAQSNKDLWTPVSESSISNIGKRYIIPSEYQTLKLDLIQMRKSLLEAPMIRTPEVKTKPVFLEIPWPDGSTKTFRIIESPCMEKGLMEKFPEIKTYAGSAVGDHSKYIKLDLTPQGFHAMILTAGEGTVYIDPYSFGEEDVEHYICYYKHDFKSSEEKEMICNVIGNPVNIDDLNPGAESSVSFSSCDLRTYRLSLSATGEYTAFHGGTIALAQAAQVTTMNRVNGIFERDMAVHMNIIANNNLIVYTNSSTDPFTNGNPSAMINENQTNTDAVISSANYDIGHVFGTNSGGLAGLGVVCSGSKARGVTGGSNPIGDPFDIDYVAHEIGHQFDANHTQYNTCNRNNGTAMEPGSASTIMGYAGICAPDVQSNSDDHFHGVSLGEIGAFVTGSGGTCAVTTALSNSAPTISGTNAGVTVPGSTPFALTCIATDPNATDVLSYCWEQMDNTGNATQPPVATNTEGPNFRSNSPDLSPTRYIPNLIDLAAGVSPTWEVLSNVSRVMNFRVSVRDNAPGSGGCTDETDVTINIDGGSGPFIVTYPSATGIIWSGNSSETVTWTVAGTDAAPISCTNADIFLSTDGGLTYPTLLASNVLNDGSHLITIPNTPTSTARIMVVCSNGTFFDISDNNFTITSSTSLIIGCTDSTAVNYDPLANTDDGSCVFSNCSVISGFTSIGSIGTCCYYEYNSTTTWTAANTLCINNGGSLVSINTTQESDSLNLLLGNNNTGGNQHWINLIDGSTNWENGDPLVFTNYDGSYNAVNGDYMFLQNNGFWDNSPNDGSQSNLGIFPLMEICQAINTSGCTDSTAVNYNPLANTDDGSCAYPAITNVTITDSIECFGGIGEITIQIMQTNPPTIGLELMVGSFASWDPTYFIKQGSIAVVGGTTIITIPGLFAGDYIVRLVNMNDYYAANPFGNGASLNGVLDQYSTIITLDEPDPLLATTVAISDNLCFGDCIAEEELTITGGTKPYSFTLNAGAPQNLASGDSVYSCTALCSGNYNIDLTDSNSCNGTQTFVITEPSIISTNIIDSACGEYGWAGVIYDTSGIYTNIFTTISGCDSTVNLTLTVFEDSSVTVLDAECDSAQWNGVWYYNDTIVTTTGLTTTNNFGGTTIGSSGKEGNIWYFGQYAGLDFNSGSPVALTNGQLLTQEGCASISDSNGDLLFYTEGSTVYNKNHAEMDNGIGLLGDESSTQSAIIVKKPGSSTIYYIFTVDAWLNLGVHYSEVDITLDGGLGDINANKNILLIPATCEKITAIKHQNGIDYWLITATPTSFHVFEVTTSGVNSSALQTTLNPIHTYGYLQASLDGSRIGVANYYSPSIDIYDFNNTTGQISNPVHLSVPNSVYSLCFSPSGNILYASQEVGSSGGILQFDLLSTNINSSAQNIGSSPTASGALSLGPDNKIYQAQALSPNLGVINNPDLLYPGCNYNPSGVSLSGKISWWGLPNFYNSITTILPSGCDSVATAIITINNSNSSIDTQIACDTFIWINGVTYTASNNTDTVMYTNVSGCDSTVTLNLTINNRTSSFTSIVACDSYSWSVNSNTYLSSGIYVDINTNVSGCINIDSLDLTINNYIVNTIDTACGEFLWGGVMYDTSGTYTNIFTDINGCDSTINLTLTVFEDSSVTVIDTECDSAQWNGIWYYNDTVVTTTGLTTTNYFGGNSSSGTSSGKEGNIWYFGQNAGLDFNSGSPVSLTDGMLNTLEGCATISDNNGDLLFYTDGMTVYNANHTIMPNGTGLLGHNSSTQSSIIVKKPGSTTIYYIFTVDGISGNSGGLNYSEVDMTLDGGLGDINSNKNILLIPATCEKVTAITHQNGSDFWIVSRLENSNTYNSFLLTISGINTIPVVSSIGSSSNGALGYLRSSSDGTKLAAANMPDAFPQFPVVDIFDFDKNTGFLSNDILLTTGLTSPYGIEFSPDGNLLYVADHSPMSVWQYDLNAPNINNSQTLIGTTSTGASALQLGPDNKIYVAQLVYGFLGVIDNPNIIGTGCNFNPNGVNLNGGYSNAGLPTFYSSIFNTVAEGCDSVATAIITINNSTSNTTTLTECDSYTWPVNGTTYTTSGVDISISTNAAGCTHVDSLVLTINNSTSASMSDIACDSLTWYGNLYTTSGIYTFQSTNAAGCNHTETLNLTINRSTNSTEIISSCLPVTWNGNSYSSSGNYTLLTTNSNGCDSTANLDFTIEAPVISNIAVNACNTYYWNGMYYEKSGIYTYTTTDNMGCENTTILSLTIFNDNLYVPNTFTPNSDIINDKFIVKHNLKEFNMWIYNRWGEEIFYTDNAELGWDGTYKNKICQDGVYLWVILFKCLDKIEKETGHIQLLR